LSDTALEFCVVSSIVNLGYMYTIYSFVSHHNTLTIVRKFDLELLVGCGWHYMDQFIGSVFRDDHLWDQGNDSLYSRNRLLQDTILSTMCKNCITESADWCCSNSVNITPELLQCSIENCLEGGGE
jgi:hypothetical protein